MFLLERISTKSNAFRKLCQVIHRMEINTFEASWMIYPSWDNINDIQLKSSLLFWATPLCSLSTTENVLTHLKTTQKVWRSVCQEMDKAKDPGTVSKFFQVLGLIIDCYTAIFRSRHISENNVRLGMNSITREISLLITPLLNGGYKSLANHTIMPREDLKFVRHS